MEQKNEKKRIRILTAVLTAVLCLCILDTVLIVRLYSKTAGLEQNQEENREQISILKEQINDAFSSQLEDETQTFISLCDASHYNILFVGNSITRHEKSSYWWSEERSMASTSLEKDYVHLLTSDLKDYVYMLKSNAEKGINSYAFNFSIWERQAYDREETYSSLDPCLQNGKALDCVVIQLGENMIYDEDSTFSSDYSSLISHIKSKAPYALIITVGDFWADKNKDQIKKKLLRSRMFLM